MLKCLRLMLRVRRHEAIAGGASQQPTELLLQTCRDRVRGTVIRHHSGPLKRGRKGTALWCFVPDQCVRIARRDHSRSTHGIAELGRDAILYDRLPLAAEAGGRHLLYLIAATEALVQCQCPAGELVAGIERHVRKGEGSPVADVRVIVTAERAGEGDETGCLFEAGDGADGGERPVFALSMTRGLKEIVRVVLGEGEGHPQPQGEWLRGEERLEQRVRADLALHPIE